MTDAHISRWKEGGIGRRMSFSGFVLLVVCFFLPQVQSCNKDYVPASEVINNVSDEPGGALLLLLTLLLPFTVAFLASIIYVVRPALRSARARRAMTMTLCWMALLVMVVGSVALTISFALEERNGSSDPAMASGMKTEDIICVVCLSVMLAAAIVALIAVIRARQHLKATVAIACLGVAFAAYFLMMALTGEPLYGIWVSITACGLIAVGGLWEALAAPRPCPACAAPETAESEP